MDHYFMNVPSHVTHVHLLGLPSTPLRFAYRQPDGTFLARLQLAPSLLFLVEVKLLLGETKTKRQPKKNFKSQEAVLGTWSTQCDVRLANI